MDKTAIANKLRNELREAANSYYNIGTPLMTDEQYDYKLDKLRSLEKELNEDFGSNVVGAPVLDKLNTVSIDPPMLSLEKCHTVDEIKKFANGFALVATAKCDGVSTRLIYKDGKLVSANTRGNGTEGTDITEHCKYYTNIPQTIDLAGTVIVDGETIIKNKDFDTIKEKQGLKNSRNAVAGTLNNLDMKVTASRRLSFIAWDLIHIDSLISPDANFYDKLIVLIDLRFEVVPWQVIYHTDEDFDKVNEYMINIAENYCGIPTDGVVYRINDYNEATRRGRTAHHFSGSLAWKPQYEEYCTYLRSIDYDVSRMGLLTPVAVFDPVIIDGTEVSRASLSNISILKSTLGEHPFVGQEIYVIKANKIIPMIIRAKDEYKEWI